MSGTWCAFCGKVDCWSECPEQKAAMARERIRDAAETLLAAAEKALMFHQRGIHTLDDASRRSLVEAVATARGA